MPLAPSRAKSSSWLINESRERPAVAIVPAIVLLIVRQVRILKMRAEADDGSKGVRNSWLTLARK
jgi:hypothetical protein